MLIIKFNIYIYKLYVKDWIKLKTWLLLTLTRKGIYLRLIDNYE